MRVRVKMAHPARRQSPLFPETRIQGTDGLFEYLPDTRLSIPGTFGLIFESAADVTVALFGHMEKALDEIYFELVYE